MEPELSITGISMRWKEFLETVLDGTRELPKTTLFR